MINIDKYVMILWQISISITILFIQCWYEREKVIWEIICKLK